MKRQKSNGIGWKLCLSSFQMRGHTDQGHGVSHLMGSPHLKYIWKKGMFHITVTLRSSRSLHNDGKTIDVKRVTPDNVAIIKSQSHVSWYYVQSHNITIHHLKLYYQECCLNVNTELLNSWPFRISKSYSWKWVDDTNKPPWWYEKTQVHQKIVI